MKVGKFPTIQCVVYLICIHKFKHLDINNSGVVEFDEFVTLMQERAQQRLEEEKQIFMEAFKVFDQNGSGEITAEE